MSTKAFTCLIAFHEIVPFRRFETRSVDSAFGDSVLVGTRVPAEELTEMELEGIPKMKQNTFCSYLKKVMSLSIS